jgi:hypothetical protein
MIKWECQMFYGKKLYTGHYWTDELSLARARKKVAELQRFHPSMRFTLTDWQEGRIIDLHTNTKELA